MTAVNTKSTQVSNLDSLPPVMNSFQDAGGVLRELIGTVEISATDDNDSVYRMCRVHSSWRIADIIRYNDAIQSGVDFDVGLYDTAENGGAVVNVNAYADAVSLASGSVTGTKDLYEAGSDKGIEKIGQKVWQDAGLTEDPNKWFDLCYTGVAVGSGAGTVSVRVHVVTPY